MTFNFKKALIIGATSGIGEALASRLVDNGVSVIVVGRRGKNLEKFVKRQNGKAEAIVFDITKLDEIPKFALDVCKAHPDLDCVFLNSGIQRGFDFSRPESIDLGKIREELTTNYLAFVHLTVAFLPHLQQQQNETSLIYTSSQLGLVPIIRCANYGATKAALHHFILALREQIKSGPGHVKVVEIFPPAVQTELHDAKHQPDIENGGRIGIPLDQFVKETWDGLTRGEDQIAVGTAKTFFEAFEVTRQESFHQMIEFMKQFSGSNP